MTAAGLLNLVNKGGMGDKGVENRLISQSLGMWCGVV